MADDSGSSTLLRLISLEEAASKIEDCSHSYCTVETDEQGRKRLVFDTSAGQRIIVESVAGFTCWEDPSGSG